MDCGFRKRLRQYRGLFDRSSIKRRVKIDSATIPKELSALIQSCQSTLFTPIDKVGSDGKADPIAGQVSVEEAAKASKTFANALTVPLFSGVPATKLYVG